jgi:hypothetical protein
MRDDIYIYWNSFEIAFLLGNIFLRGEKKEGESRSRETHQ